MVLHLVTRDNFSMTVSGFVQTTNLEGDSQINLFPDFPDVFLSQIPRETDLRQLWRKEKDGFQRNTCSKTPKVDTFLS